MAYLLGELEQKVMDVLWSSENPVKVADVQNTLGDKYAYTTIMTVLKRLCEKELLDRKMEGNVYYYCALKCRSDFAGKKLGHLFSQIVNSYGDLAISKFVDALSQSPEDIKILKDYLKKSED